MTRKTKLEKALAFNIWFFNKNVILYNNDVIDDAEKHHERHLATLHAALIEAVEALESILDVGESTMGLRVPNMNQTAKEALSKLDKALEEMGGE